MIQTEENILNVTLLEPRAKHPTIFARYDALNPGESLTIHNDHDPKPLYYQLLGERGDAFTWQYLKEGPEWWFVRITKKTADQPRETIGEIAAKDIRKAQVFKKYGLDFCCGGKKTLNQACAEKGLDVVQVEKELGQADPNVKNRPLPYNEWSPEFLVDYIVNTHHSYVRKTLPDLMQFSAKVATVHGAAHPELAKVNQLVGEINAELISHMAKEEKILFPYIKNLAHSLQNNNSIKAAGISGPINAMEMEHDMVGNLCEEVRKITNNYALPADACTTYSLLFGMLQEFEDDLHLHIHLENNILFKKALEMESQAARK